VSANVVKSDVLPCIAITFSLESVICHGVNRYWISRSPSPSLKKRPPVSVVHDDLVIFYTAMGTFVGMSVATQ